MTHKVYVHVRLYLCIALANNDTSAHTNSNTLFFSFAVGLIFSYRQRSFTLQIVKIELLRLFISKQQKPRSQIKQRSAREIAQEDICDSFSPGVYD